jgi:hypothetical protein
MKLWQATLDTRNFHFEAFAADKADAWSALFQALVRHGKHYGLPEDWISEYLDAIEYRAVTLGSAYRDREPI